MPTAWPGTASPFDVAAGYHPFVDYRYVHAGRSRWLDANGHEPDFWEPVAGNSWLTPAHVAVPHGIRLELQPAAKSEPFILGDKPWEYWLVDSVDTVIRDGGLYRLWYEGAPEDLLDAERSRRLPAQRYLGRGALLRRIRGRPDLAQTRAWSPGVERVAREQYRAGS